MLLVSIEFEVDDEAAFERLKIALRHIEDDEGADKEQPGWAYSIMDIWEG